jgi:putative DNA primase/helicase
MSVAAGNGADGPQFALTVSPGPVINAYGRAVELDAASPVESFARALEEMPTSKEAWFAAGVFRDDHRKNVNWLSACSVTVDLDHHNAADDHTAAPPEIRAALELALSDAPCCIRYATPRGLRLIDVLSAPVCDLETWSRAAAGKVAQVESWLARHGLGWAAGRGGLVVDGATEKAAQFMFGPRSLVEGVRRKATVEVMRREPVRLGELLALAPPPEKPKPPPVVRSAPALARFEEARQAFNADHPLEATRRGAPCPAAGCEGRNSFKALGDTGKATCFHSSHPEACGGPGEGCRVFDAADLAAHNAGRKVREHLVKECYLAPAPVREEPPHPADAATPPPRSREPGEDDGDAPTAGGELLRARIGAQWNCVAPPWPDPRPIIDKLFPVEPLRLELLPDALGAWVFDIAERMQVPAEFPAGAALVALGSLLTNRCTIRPKCRDNWAVDPNIWGAVVGQPGIMKTPAVNEGLAPLRRLAAETREQHQRDQKAADALEEIAEAQRAVRRRRLKKAVEADSKVAIEGLKAELVAEDNQGLPEPHPYLLNDTTTEKLVDMAQKSPRAFLVFRDELSGFFSYLERDGHEADRALYTEAWEPKPFRQDRIARGTVYVERLGVSIFGTIQPGPLFKHIRGALKNGDAADGFIQRFQLLFYPDVSPTWRNVDRYPDTDRKRAAFRLFKAIDTIPPRELGAVLDEHDKLPHFRFDEGGQAVFDAWRAELERKVRNLDEPALQGHLAKYRKLMPALALLFELAQRVENARGGGQVGEAAALLAVEWTRLLEQHAARVYQAATNGDTAGARLLTEKLRTSDLKDVFTARDVYRHQWTGLVDPGETMAAIAHLIDAGWLREELRPPGAGGGRPSEAYRVNPAARTPPTGGYVSIGGTGGLHFSSSSLSGGTFLGTSEAPGTDKTDKTPRHEAPTGEVFP